MIQDQTSSFFTPESIWLVMPPLSRRNASFKKRRAPFRTVSALSLLLSTGLVMLLCRPLISSLDAPSFHDYSDLLVGRNLAREKTLSGDSVSSLCQASICVDYELHCQTVQEHINDRSWTDPNDGIYAIRRTRVVNQHEPTFIVSLHKKEYDPMRYSSIFER